MFQVSRRVDYAVRMMVELGLPPDGACLPARQLSKKTGVPKAFLHKITADLVKANLVQTQAGPHGGLKLQRDASQISLLHIVEAIEGPICLNVCLIRPHECNRDLICPAHTFWGRLQTMLVAQLSTTNLTDLVAEAKVLQQQPRNPQDNAHIPYLFVDFANGDFAASDKIK